MRVFTHATNDEIRRAYARSDEVLLSARNHTWFDYANVGLDGIEMWIPIDVFCAAVGLEPADLLPIFWETERDRPEGEVTYEDLRGIRIDEIAKFCALAKLLTRPLHVRQEDGSSGRHSSYIRAWPEGHVDYLWARRRVEKSLSYRIRPHPAKSLQTLLNEGKAAGTFVCRFALDDGDLWPQPAPDGSEVTVRLLCLNERGRQMPNNGFGKKEDWVKFGVRPVTPREFVTLAHQEGITLLDALNGVVMCPTVWLLPNHPEPVGESDYDRYVLEWIRRHEKANIVPQNVVTTYDCPVYWAVVETN
jgi:hypothetical protein